jgi:hypothetical protein
VNNMPGSARRHRPPTIQDQARPGPATNRGTGGARGFLAILQPSEIPWRRWSERRDSTPRPPSSPGVPADAATSEAIRGDAKTDPARSSGSERNAQISSVAHARRRQGPPSKQWSGRPPIMAAELRRGPICSSQA